MQAASFKSDERTVPRNGSIPACPAIRVRDADRTKTDIRF